jgi:hypothetical protein
MMERRQIEQAFEAAGYRDALKRKTIPKYARRFMGPDGRIVYWRHDLAYTDKSTFTYENACLALAPDDRLHESLQGVQEIQIEGTAEGRNSNYTDFPKLSKGGIDEHTGFIVRAYSPQAIQSLLNALPAESAARNRAQPQFATNPPNSVEHLRSKIKSETALSAFDKLVKSARELTDYELIPGRHGFMNNFRYVNISTKEQPFCFSVASDHLLFYIRRPGIELVRDLYSTLQSLFEDVSAANGEWLFRIQSPTEAAELHKLLFDADYREEIVAATEADTIEKSIERRTDISRTTKLQLVKARVGQNIYRYNVMTIENFCRVTGVTDKSLLRASHIKPWSKCDTDEERLDRYNGLLLAPHVDLLFDQFFISFENNGTMLVSDRLSRDALNKWNLDCDRNVGTFLPEQVKYLEFHRSLFFKSPKNNHETRVE